jgi:hypothetical protein
MEKAYEPKLEYAFSIRVDFGPRYKMGPMINGMSRGYVGVTGGTITGPRLQGTVVPHSGGDWPFIREDGIVEFFAVYLLQAADGTLMQIQNRGCRNVPPEIMKRMDNGEPVDPTTYYFRIAPIFEVPVGPHDWMSRTVFVGAAERTETYSNFDYYAVM